MVSDGYAGGRGGGEFVAGVGGGTGLGEGDGDFGAEEMVLGFGEEKWAVSWDVFDGSFNGVEGSLSSSFFSSSSTSSSSDGVQHLLDLQSKHIRVKRRAGEGARGHLG